MTFQILRALPEESKEGSKADPELLSNLKRLVPWQHFEVMGVGIVKLATPPGKGASAYKPCPAL